MLHALILGSYFAFVFYLFYYYLKNINYSIKKKKKKKNRKKSPLRGFSLRRYVVTRYAVTRFTNNRDPVVLPCGLFCHGREICWPRGHGVTFVKSRGKPFGFLRQFIFSDWEKDKYLVHIDLKAVILAFFRNQEIQLFCSALLSL